MTFKKPSVTQMHIRKAICLLQKEEEDDKKVLATSTVFLELEQEAGILLQSLGT
jgi:hypothetical protein